MVGAPLVVLRESYQSGPLGRQAIVSTVASLEQTRTRGAEARMSPDEERRLIASPLEEFRAWLDERLPTFWSARRLSGASADPGPLKFRPRSRGVLFGAAGALAVLALATHNAVPHVLALPLLLGPAAAATGAPRVPLSFRVTWSSEGSRGRSRSPVPAHPLGGGPERGGRSHDVPTWPRSR